jgi:hypothetical protein
MQILLLALLDTFWLWNDMSKDDLNVRDLVPVIEETIKRLPNGDSRILASKFGLSRVCLAGFGTPDITELINSDYSMPSANKEIVQQFYEEVGVIEKVLEEMKIPNRRDLDSLNRRAYALKIWEIYAIPWRFYNDAVHLIWAPRDLVSSPIIRSYPTSYFLRELAEIFENGNGQFWKEARSLKYWRTIAVSCLVIIILALFFVRRY